MAMISAAAEIMGKDFLKMPFIFTGDFNAQAGSLLTRVGRPLVQGRGQLLEGTSVPEPVVGRSKHLKRIRDFKEDTWDLRGLALPKVGPRPKPRWLDRDDTSTTHPNELSAPGGDLAVPVTLAFVPKADKLRHIIRTTLDLENDVVTHPLDLLSEYGVRKIPNFIFHSQLMGCRPRLDLVARLEFPDMLLQLKAALHAAHRGSQWHERNLRRICSAIHI
ncbi:unnamed protein product [Mortierella alpina]